MSPRTKEQLTIIREEKSHRIAEAALKLFAAKGYDGTSISEIAREAKISKGLIYNYYESKEHILREIVGKVFETAWKSLGLGEKIEMNDERYRHFIVRSIDMVLEDLDHYRLYFAVFTQPQVLSLLWDDLMVKSAPYLKVLHDYYEQKGFENPAVQMRYVGAIIDGIQMHIMLDPENFPVEEVKRLLIEQFT